MTNIDDLLRRLAHPGLPLELAALAGSLATAFLLAWVVGRRHSTESVWFGRATVDGLLFPLLALVFTYSASLALRGTVQVALLKIAVPVLVSLVGIRFLARVFTVVFPRSGLARLVERLFSWLAWIAAVLWIIGLLPRVMSEMDDIHFAFGHSRISLLSIVQAVLSSGAVLVIALWISAALERTVLREAVADLSLRKVASNAIRATLLLVGLLFALSAVGVDLTALSVLGGALGVGLGFGLQKLAANYVSGFVILFERSLRIGDTVRVENLEGIVVDIKTRYTLIRSLSGIESVVPNEKLIAERIDNLSLSDPKVLLTTDIGVAYDSDVELVQRVLAEAAAGAPRVLPDPPPTAKLARFGADALEFTLLYWIADPQSGQLGVRSDVNLRVLKALREAGIEIPFPQRVVHLRSAHGESAAAPSVR